MDLSSSNDTLESTRDVTQTPRPSEKGSFVEVVNRVVNPAQKGNKTTYHPCCRSFSKRSRPKKTRQDCSLEHLENVNLRSIFSLDKRLTEEEAWSQFVQWSEQSNHAIDLQAGFLINQKTCLKRLEVLQKKAAETEFLQAYCQYANPIQRDSLLKEKTLENELLQERLKETELKLKEHEKKDGEKAKIIQRQKASILTKPFRPIT